MRRLLRLSTDNTLLCQVEAACTSSPSSTRIIRHVDASLIGDAHTAGYTVVLHVLLIPEDLAVERVKHRVAAGGHDVPESKIRQSHRRLWGRVAEAIMRADNATVYDNSRLVGPRIVAEMSAGHIVGATSWPATRDPLPSHWPK